MAVVVGAAVAAVLQYLIRLPLGLRTMVSIEELRIRITQPALVFADFTILGGLATFVYVNLRTARLAMARRRSAEISRLETRRRTLESQLQAMQARVEPQFLFNTLAQVRQLYDSDATIAGRMLDDLIAYLRAALPHLRESSSTLGKEAELARAYLDIVRVRLGERLAFDIDVPGELADARLPPMMLLPLIDHVLVYGLEPSQAGGSIRIQTDVGDGKLRLAITDSGAGFVPGGDAGDLTHIGERLYALYGDAAALRLERLQGAATKAILEIPYEPADRSDR
jgi:LytS/YehU family sensor histidine kinase